MGDLAFEVVPGRQCRPEQAAARPGAEPTTSSAALTGLLDPRFDHDSCGVGFVATLRNKPSYEILDQALCALGRLAHRGAIAADGKSSDGVGVMTSIPRDFLLSAAGLSLEQGQPFAAGVVFLPVIEAASRRARSLLEAALASQDLKVLAWRQIPTNPAVLGKLLWPACLSSSRS